MSKSLHEMIDTELDKYYMRLTLLAALSDELASKISRGVVERNYDFMQLRSIPPEVLDDEHVLKRMHGHAAHDWEIKQDAITISEKAGELATEIKKTADLIGSLHVMAETQIGNAEAEKIAAIRRVSELTERLKEHALNDAEVREKVWAITDGKCFYCEVELIRGAEAGIGHPRLFHIDHLVPRSLGGPDHLANYVPACGSCNISKHARHFAEFIMSLRAKQEPPLLKVIEGGAA